MLSEDDIDQNEKMFRFLHSSDIKIFCKDGISDAHSIVLSLMMNNEEGCTFSEKIRDSYRLFCDFLYEDMERVLSILYFRRVKCTTLKKYPIIFEILNFLHINIQKIEITDVESLDDDDPADEHTVDLSGIHHNDIDNVGEITQSNDNIDENGSIIDSCGIVISNNTNTELPRICKRGTYNHYSKMKIDFSIVMKALLNSNEHGSIKNISTKTGIPTTTLSRWRRKAIINPKYIPSSQSYSLAKLAINNEVEKKLANYINTTFITQGRLITKKFLLLRCNIYLSHETIEEHQYLSIKWLNGFLKRHSFSFRNVRTKRRPDITPDTISKYLYEFSKILEDYPYGSIYNMDETSWIINQPPKKTIARRGSDTVNGFITSDSKSSFTSIGTISKSGKKLPLVILVKGKTQLSIRSFEPQNFPVEYITTSSGWSDTEVMKSYLSWLISFNGNDDFALIMDQYPSHIKLYDYIKEVNPKIRVLFIPKGATGILQPLDRLIFGVLKSKGNSKWIKFYNNTNGISPTKAESLGILLESWDEIDEKIICNSWDYSDIDNNGDFDPVTDPLDQNYQSDPNNEESE